tara:strand:+ start:17955 stop:19319 length:1365 start_codon:yes stop_codon:yes gene_type:complete
MQVSIIGTGYVGLVSGLCLASKGHKVKCYDNNIKIINSLNKGIPTIYEEGLESILNLTLKSKNFKAELISEKTNFESELIIIAVGTPSENGKIDLKYIRQVSKLIGLVLKSNDKFLSIIVKSTVTPGTTDTIVRKIIEENSGKKLGQFGLGMNPEFLREGNAIDDFMNPDRIVIGYEDDKTKKLLKRLYSPWECDKIYVNTRSAEMIKYANNSLLATQISTANELANIATAIGNIDIMDVMNGVFADKRWSPILKNKKRISPEILNYLIPGCGFGGSCFPKDVQALRSKAYEVGLEPSILDAVLSVNTKQPQQAISLLKESIDELNEKKVLLLGLAFKPGTDDIRESISIKLANILLNENAKIFAHDPIAIKDTQKLFKNSKNIKFIESWEEKISNVDIIIVATKWDEYKKLLKIKLQKRIKDKVLFDLRRFFNPSDFLDCRYLTIGRSTKLYV